MNDKPTYQGLFFTPSYSLSGSDRFPYEVEEMSNFGPNLARLGRKIRINYVQNCQYDSSFVLEPYILSPMAIGECAGVLMQF